MSGSTIEDGADASGVSKAGGVKVVRARRRKPAGARCSCVRGCRAQPPADPLWGPAGDVSRAEQKEREFLRAAA